MENLNKKTQKELNKLYADNMHPDHPFFHHLLMGGVLYGLLSPMLIGVLSVVNENVQWVRITFIVLAILVTGFSLFCLCKYIITFKKIKKKYNDSIALTNAINEEVARRHQFYLSHQS